MTITNRPPSCDMAAEDKKPKLNPCFYCGYKRPSFGDFCIDDDPGDSVYCPQCGVMGPACDPSGKLWNSIPSRSEVAELLRLVDSVINTPDWTRRDEVEELIRRSDKLRKEWNL